MGSTGSLNFELQAKTYVQDTWHELPTVDSSSEGDNKKVSNWSSRAEKDGLPKVGPTGTNNVVPKDLSRGRAKEMLPMGIKVSFAKEDKAYEKFIDGPPLVKSGEMLIEGPFVRGPTHIKVKPDKNTVMIEKFSRDGLRESLGVTCMLQMLSNRLMKAIEGSISSEGEAWDPTAELKLTQQWLELVLLTSFRTGAYIQSIQVLAKDSLRKEALENLFGSNETKNNLRYSHYASPNIFGPLSADFEPYVLPSSLSHESYKLVPKWGSGGSSSQDKGFLSRASSSSETSYNKRGSNPQWGASKSKRGGHSDNLVESISPQEALRRSKENSGGRNQFFQGIRGRGRRPYQNTKRK